MSEADRFIRRGSMPPDMDSWATESGKALLTPTPPDWNKDKAAAALEQFQTARSEVRELWNTALSSILRDRAAAAATWLTQAESNFKKVWTLPSIGHQQNGALSLDYDVILSDAAAFNTFVFLLLLDESRGFWRDLCRCKLQDCQRWFLARKPPTGRPRRDYHSEECMLKSHAQGSTQRARRSRANKARKVK